MDRADQDVNPLSGYEPFPDGDSEFAKAATLPQAFPAIDPADDEIAALERRLNILESHIAIQEKQLNEARETGSFEQPPNWPRVYPLVHFDIKEIPDQLQSFVNQAMFGWCCMVVAFGLNFVACLTLLRAGEATDSPGSKIALSALYLFFLVPIALDLDALAVYRVLRSEAPGTWAFGKLFLFIGITTAYEAILTLGFESSGSCGLVTMLNLFINGHGFIGALALIVTAMLALSTFVHFRLVTALWGYYRGTEAGTGDLQTKVKGAVAELVVNALR
jgi:hypothetical protein